VKRGERHRVQWQGRTYLLREYQFRAFEYLRSRNAEGVKVPTHELRGPYLGNWGDRRLREIRDELGIPIVDDRAGNAQSEKVWFLAGSRADDREIAEADADFGRRWEETFQGVYSP